MNKRLLLGGVAVLIILAASVVLFNLNKGRVHLPLKQDKTSAASASGLLTEAGDLQMKGNLAKAKDIYQRLINEFPNSSDIVNWQKKIEELNTKLLFSSAVTEKSILYEIKPGDTLTKIAKEFKTTVELIMKSNAITDDKILPARKIKLWTAPFSILVDKSQNILILKTDEEVVKTYTVSTGANNSTPVGSFKIVNKLINPTWFKAGAIVPPDSPQNILGSRWLGFDLAGYGIHGTTDLANLGKQVTQGCVRMSNPDVEELYTIVPVGIEVTIVD